MDDDFNSSDLEIPERSNPYADLGKDSIKQMLDNAFEDRKDSKIQSKQLIFTASCPGTLVDMSRWANRFKSFRESTLNHG
jgi:hypothetical protein